VVENDDFAKFVRRIIRRYAERVSKGDIDALAQLASMADEIESAAGQAANALHQTGYSWTDIAKQIGMSRQGARQRWSPVALAARSARNRGKRPGTDCEPEADADGRSA
jgi:hypothetical protein